MDILEKIIARKKIEIDERKRDFSVKLLQQSLHFDSKPFSLKEFVRSPEGFGIIAEIKRKSPSKGVINPNVSVEDISVGYVESGASALSVLTDNEFFGGKNEDLSIARRLNECPILRKDFVIDEYQVVEAKSIGADAILLIAAVLKPNQITELTRFAHQFKLEVLLEVHSLEELESNLDAGVDLIGVNNRNLKTFEVDINTSRNLVQFIPKELPRISESGIGEAGTIMDLRSHGFDGFLIGEQFMKHERPEIACREFIGKLRTKMEA